MSSSPMVNEFYNSILFENLQVLFPLERMGASCFYRGATRIPGGLK
jgi:hypothetical protein